MTGKTHLFTGLAITSALIPSMNVDSNTYAIALGLAGIGALMPDVDLKQSKISNIAKKIITDLLMLSFLLMYVSKNIGMPKLSLLISIKNPGVYILIGCLIFSMFTEHRSFSHSILGLCLFSISFYLLFKQNAMYFTIGYISHIILDLFNFTGERLLYPLENEYSLEVMHSDSVGNCIVGILSLTLFVYQMLF